MLKTLVLVIAAFAIETTVAPAAAPKVTSIRLVSDGGFVAHRSVTVVDRRNRAALARMAALVPAKLPRLQPVQIAARVFAPTVVERRRRRTSSTSWGRDPERRQSGSWLRREKLLHAPARAVPAGPC
jgi:hypothetical protein